MATSEPRDGLGTVGGRGCAGRYTWAIPVEKNFRRPIPGHELAYFMSGNTWSNEHHERAHTTI